MLSFEEITTGIMGKKVFSGNLNFYREREMISHVNKLKKENESHVKYKNGYFQVECLLNIKNFKISQISH
jgi:hypothetical protein